MPPYTTTVDSPLGALTLLSDGDVLTGLYLPVHKGAPVSTEGWVRDARPFAAVSEQLAQYFAGQRRTFDVAVQGSGTDFQQRVWAALREIPYGTTATYRDIAVRIGNRQAVRAVGLANGRNPVSIIVPCHRVVGANGSLTGYGGGLRAKQLLLDLESGTLRMPETVG